MTIPFLVCTVGYAMKKSKASAKLLKNFQDRYKIDFLAKINCCFSIGKVLEPKGFKKYIISLVDNTYFSERAIKS